MPIDVSNAMSFDASALSVAGWEVGQPFAFVDALGDASVAHALSVIVAVSASATTAARMLLRIQATSGAQNGDGHCRHQEHLANDDLNRRDLIEEQCCKNRCGWWHGESAK